MSLTRKILSNTFWQILGRFVTALVGVLSIKVVTSYLPSDIYGQYTTVYEFIGFFAVAADFGLYTIGVREMAKKERSESEILANLLALRIILITVTLVLAGVVAQFIPRYADSFVAQGIWIVALTTGLTLFSGTLSSILQYRLKMQFANIAIILSRFVSIGYILYVVYILAPTSLSVAFQHLLYAGVFSGIVLLALTYFFVRRESQIYFDFNWKYTKELVYKALPYGLALILSSIYFKIDIIFLSLIKDYHEVGIYGVALKFMEILSVIPVFLLNSALPALTEAFNNNKERFYRLIAKLWTFLNLLAAPILVGGFVLAFPLTFAISSPQFLSGYHCTKNIQTVYQSAEIALQECTKIETSSTFAWVDTATSYIHLYGADIALKLILFAMFFSFLNSLFSFSLVAIDKQAKLIVTNAIGVIFNIVTNLLLIPVYGFIGAALTTIASEIIILGGTYYYIKKYTSPTFSLKNSFLIYLSAIIMGIIIFYLQAPTYQLMQNLNIFILIPVGATIYGTLVYSLKIVTNDDIKKLLSKS